MLHAGLDLSRRKVDVCFLDQGAHLDQLVVRHPALRREILRGRCRRRTSSLSRPSSTLTTRAMTRWWIDCWTPMRKLRPFQQERGFLRDGNVERRDGISNSLMSRGRIFVSRSRITANSVIAWWRSGACEAPGRPATLRSSAFSQPCLSSGTRASSASIPSTIREPPSKPQGFRSRRCRRRTWRSPGERTTPGIDRVRPGLSPHYWVRSFVEGIRREVWSAGGPGSVA
jgi:hypothetical protein